MENTLAEAVILRTAGIDLGQWEARRRAINAQVVCPVCKEPLDEEEFLSAIEAVVIDDRVQYIHSTCRPKLEDY